MKAVGRRRIIISRQENGRFLILGRAVLILPGIKRKKGRVSQAVTKDLSSSSKFSGSCVLTLQTLPKRKRKRKEGASVRTNHRSTGLFFNSILK